MKAKAYPLFILPIALVSLLFVQQASAGSATWNLNPTSNDWNSAINWTPATVPNGPDDIAAFEFSNQPVVFLSAATEVSGLVFDPGAPAYSITPKRGSVLTISGTGITNNSGQLQSFTCSVDQSGNFGQVLFINNAAAGSNTSFLNQGGGAQGAETDFLDMATADNGAFTNQGGSVYGGFTRFFDFSNAGHAIITNQQSEVSLGMAGHSEFFDTSTAAHATITNEGGTGTFLFPGTVFFNDTSDAGQSIIINNGGDAIFSTGAFATFDDTSSAGSATIVANGGNVSGATTQFLGHSSALSATLIANGTISGGLITFQDSSSGGVSRIKLIGNGALDISLHAPNLAIGSLEGGGSVQLGANHLTVGTNNLDTFFNGVIDGAGSLIKGGHGKWVLGGASTYAGGTVVAGGRLLVASHTGSATSNGPVQVDEGELGGTGKIAGPVTIGTGGSIGASLAPGLNSVSNATLLLERTLTIRSFAKYKVTFDSAAATSDTVIANGVTLESSAFIYIRDNGFGTLPIGTIFVLINNSAATPIAGRFSNLADNSFLGLNENKFEVSYEGGDGNDLTLTVVP